MTKHRPPSLFILAQEDEPGDPLPAASFCLGPLTILTADPAFLEGYEEGQAQYAQWHSHDCDLEASTLLFLVRNGWGSDTHSAMWQAGYIVGWLFALFARATGQQVGEEA